MEKISHRKTLSMISLLFWSPPSFLGVPIWIVWSQCDVFLFFLSLPSCVSTPSLWSITESIEKDMWLQRIHFNFLIVKGYRISTFLGKNHYLRVLSFFRTPIQKSEVTPKQVLPGKWSTWKTGQSGWKRNVLTSSLLFAINTQQGYYFWITL